VSPALTRLARIEFDAPTHTYTVVRVDAEGREQRHVPRWSVTGVLKAAGYLAFDRIPLATLEAARERGRRVHTALQYFTEGTLDWSTVAEADKGYVESGAALIQSGQIDVLAQEVRVWHPAWDYVGTLDLLAWWQQGAAVMDFKSGNPADVAAHLQTAAYVEALRALIAIGQGPIELIDAAPGDPIARASIALRRDGAMAQLVPYRGAEHVQDWPLFQAALLTVRHREALRGRIVEEYAA